MSTDDITKISSKCLCGNGTITVTISSPDHPWARESQTSYSASIDCDECRRTHTVYESYLDRYPSIVLISDVEAYESAKARLHSAGEVVLASDEAKRLIPRIIDVVDAQPSMAATHRVLRRFGLTHHSLGTFRRQPYGGNEAVRRISGRTLAAIGSLPDMGHDDVRYFMEVARDLAALSDAEAVARPKSVHTGVRGLAK